MKKVLLVCAFLVGMSAVSFAQGGQRGGFNQTPDQRIETLKTQVTGITDDQVAKLKVIYTGAVKTQDSIRTAANGDFSSMMPKIMAMNTSTDAKIMAVLTPEQAAAYKKIADARAEAMKQRMQGN